MPKQVEKMGEQATHPLSHNNIIKHDSDFVVPGNRPRFVYELPKDFPFNEVCIAKSLSGSGNQSGGNEGQSGNKSSG